MPDGVRGLQPVPTIRGGVLVTIQPEKKRKPTVLDYGGYNDAGVERSPSAEG